MYNDITSSFNNFMSLRFIRKTTYFITYAIILFLLFHFVHITIYVAKNQNSVKNILKNISSIKRNRLHLWSPEIRANRPMVRDFHCKAAPNWLHVNQGKVLFVHLDEIKCTAQPIIRVDDNNFKLGETVPLHHGDNIPSDGFQTTCEDVLTKNVQKILYGGIKRHAHIPISSSPYNGPHYNILLLSLDSLSRLEWQRSLPSVLSEIVNMSGVIFEHYNVVGDGTPAAMQPILTGLNEEELPESRKGHPGATTLDNHPWIFRRLHELGYVTQWFEEQTQFGTYQMRMMGFKDPPVHHYMRPYNMAQQKAAGGSYCLGSQSQVERQLDIIKELFYVYPDRPKFSQLHMADIGHQNYDVSFMSSALVSFLQWLKKNGHHKNTVVLVFSDHGARFSNLRSTLQGRLEERLPLMSMILPDNFQKREPLLTNNVVENRMAIVTPYDIHATLQNLLDITCGLIENKRLSFNLSNRAASLLHLISKERTCSNAGIPLHWCAFSQLISISPSEQQSNLIQGAVAAFITFVNQLTENYRSLCAELRFKQIISVQKESLQTDMLRFKQSADDRGISKAKLVDAMSGGLLQINLMTQPNDAQYDVSILWFRKSNADQIEYRTALESTSRIDRYGSQPNCIYQNLPYLRPFCYCIK